MAATDAVLGPGWCPVCGGAPGSVTFPYEMRWNGVDYNWLRCTTCATSVIDPLPHSDALYEGYAWDTYHRVNLMDDPNRHAKALLALRQLLPATRSLLDFGCGTGGFLATLSRSRIDCFGVEHHPSAVAAAAERSGVPVCHLDELIASGRRFDVIHMSDVLTHLPDPAGTMRTLASLLGDRGRFLIEGPLERNASPVYWSAVGVKAARRLLRHDPVASRQPTMLFRVNRDTQRWFFAERLGYAEEHFAVYETGWPFRYGGQQQRWVRRGIAASAILASRLDPSRPRRFGNRFLAILRPAR